MAVPKPMLTAPSIGKLYKKDFHRWVTRQVAALEAGRLDEIDVDNLAEELRAVGRSEEHQIENRLLILLTHLLKWGGQPDKKTAGWEATIAEQRYRINRLLQKSPSLARFPAIALEEEYRLARLRAAAKTGLPLEHFPETCPFTIHDVLDEMYLPSSLKE